MIRIISPQWCTESKETTLKQQSFTNDLAVCKNLQSGRQIFDRMCSKWHEVAIE